MDMDYYLIRKKFCDLSGRYDLMNIDYTDNGADFFLNAGQRFLDRMQDTGKMQAKNVQSVAAGTIKVYIAGLRAIKEVFIGNSTEKLIKLKRASLSYLRQYYEEQLGDVDQGTPEWYAPAVFRPFADASTTTSFSGFYDIDDLILPATTTPVHYTYDGIIIAPPPDSTFYVSIYGLYYSPELSATLSGTWTQTKSFWSEVHPDLLLQAGLYKLETFYRNTEGAKDWLGALKLDVDGIDKDAAYEESSEISEMGG
jgi:hypothetical protein